MKNNATVSKKQEERLQGPSPLSSETRAYVADLAKKFAVRTPISLNPPEPAAFGYSHLSVEVLDPQTGKELGESMIPQAFFMRIYELLTQNVASVPAGSSLRINFTTSPVDEIRQ